MPCTANWVNQYTEKATKGMKWFWHTQAVVFDVHNSALYALIKTTSGTRGERPFPLHPPHHSALNSLLPDISSGQKPTDTKKVTATSQEGFKHQMGSHQAPTTALGIHEGKHVMHCCHDRGPLLSVFIGPDHRSLLKPLVIFSFTNFCIFLEILKPLCLQKSLPRWL